MDCSIAKRKRETHDDPVSTKKQARITTGLNAFQKYITGNEEPTVETRLTFALLREKEFEHLGVKALRDGYGDRVAALATLICDGRAPLRQPPVTPQRSSQAYLHAAQTIVAPVSTMAPIPLRQATQLSPFAGTPAVYPLPAITRPVFSSAPSYLSGTGPYMQPTLAAPPQALTYRSLAPVTPPHLTTTASDRVATPRAPVKADLGHLSGEANLDSPGAPTKKRKSSRSPLHGLVPCDVLAPACELTAAEIWTYFPRKILECPEVLERLMRNGFMPTLLAKLVNSTHGLSDDHGISGNTLARPFRNIRKNSAAVIGLPDPRLGTAHWSKSFNDVLLVELARDVVAHPDGNLRRPQDAGVFTRCLRYAQACPDEGLKISGVPGLIQRLDLAWTFSPLTADDDFDACKHYSGEFGLGLKKGTCWRGDSTRSFI